MWLSGSRLRNRIGLNGRMYRRYFAISRSIGTMFARMLRCVSTTPLGSAVAPDVKMISAVVSGPDWRGARDRDAGPGRRSQASIEQPVQTPDGSVGSERSGVHDVTGQDGLRIDDRRDLAEKVRRCPVVDRHDNHALDQRAPHCGDPLRPVLAPDRDGLSVRDTARPQELRKRQRPPRPRMSPTPP